MGKTQGDRAVVNIWFLSGLVSLFSGAALLLTKYVLEKDGIPLWAIILLLVMAAAGFIMSDVYAHIVNVPPAQDQAPPEPKQEKTTAKEPENNTPVFEEQVAETEE